MILIQRKKKPDLKVFVVVIPKETDYKILLYCLHRLYMSYPKKPTNPCLGMTTTKTSNCLPLDEYDATYPRPACIQETHVQLPSIYPIGHVNIPTSEDCLYVNLWLPHPRESSRPVMVITDQFFIHSYTKET